MENMKVSIGLVVAFVMQFSGFVWWTAQQAQTIEDLEVKVSTLTAKDTVTAEVNTRRDIEELQKEVDYLWGAIDELDNDIDEAIEEVYNNLDK